MNTLLLLLFSFFFLYCMKVFFRILPGVVRVVKKFSMLYVTSPHTTDVQERKQFGNSIISGVALNLSSEFKLKPFLGINITRYNLKLKPTDPSPKLVVNQESPIYSAIFQ